MFKRFFYLFFIFALLEGYSLKASQFQVRNDTGEKNYTFTHVSGDEGVELSNFRIRVSYRGLNKDSWTWFDEHSEEITKIPLPENVGEVSAPEFIRFPGMSGIFASYITVYVTATQRRFKLVSGFNKPISRRKLSHAVNFQVIPKWYPEEPALVEISSIHIPCIPISHLFISFKGVKLEPEEGQETVGADFFLMINGTSQKDLEILESIKMKDYEHED